MKEFSFSNITVHNSIYKDLDINELIWKNSGKFNNIKDGFRGYLNPDLSNLDNRYKEIVWNGYFMFKELELKVAPGMGFFGFEFDNLFIGKP